MIINENLLEYLNPLFNVTYLAVRPLSTSTPLPPPLPQSVFVHPAHHMGHPQASRRRDDDLLDDLSKISDSSTTSLQPSETPMIDTARSAARRQPQPVYNYKTRLCMQYQQNGHCPLAERCRFAHGDDELRLAVDVCFF